MKSAASHIELNSVDDFNKLVEQVGPAGIMAISEPYYIAASPMLSMDIISVEGRRFLATGPDTLGTTEIWMSNLAARLRAITPVQGATK